MRPFRAAIRVRPGSNREGVGPATAAVAGRATELPPLEVRVRARPVEGAATSAAERVLAAALGLRPRQVRVIRGQTSRDKLVEVADPPPDIGDRWIALLRAEPARD